MRKFIYILTILMSTLSIQTLTSQIELETVVIPAQKKSMAKPLENQSTPQINTITTQNTDNEENTDLTLRYYYFPNLSAYFDLKLEKYIYKVDGMWVMRDNIPPNYRGYSVYNNYRVSIADYFDDTPYELLAEHRKLYPADYTGKLRKIELIKKQTADRTHEKQATERKLANRN